MMMMMTMMQVLFLLFLSSSSPTAAATCPVNLSYVERLPWNISVCPTITTGATTTAPTKTCCQALLSLFGIGLSLHLKQTSHFQLPDLPTATTCVSSFQTRLTSLSLPPNITSTCSLTPDRFTTGPQLCAGIQTIQDWVDKLGSSTQMDSSCRSDLSAPTSCNACLSAGLKVQSKLTSLDGNSSHSTDCFYFTVLYAGGIINKPGPESIPTAACIFGLPMSSSPTSQSKSHTVLILTLVGVGLAILLIISLLALYFLWENHRRKKMIMSLASFDLDENSSKYQIRPNAGAIWFKLKELEKATENFSEKNLIGRGGYGIVYRGILSDGTQVAVKKMIESNFEGNAEFKNEVEIISNVRHRNLVHLRGCCVDEVDDEEQGMGIGKYLVYDYMPNGNLNDHLFDTKKSLTWSQRKSIILDVAKGLAYLHNGVKPSIYHRDIKAANILLDAEMKALVADFGLVKQIKEGQSHLTTRVAGTHGYLAPEYALYGQLTDRSDVYSFGVVVLEIISGRRALDFSSSPRAILITDWAWTLVKAGETERVFDPSLLKDVESDHSPKCNKMSMERFVLVGILCAHIMVALRPTIQDAIKMLEGDIDVPVIPDRPLPLSHQAFGDGKNTFSIQPLEI